MNRTQEDYRIAQAHRDGLRTIWANYEETMQRLDRYKGSAGYEEDKREAEKKRDEAIRVQAQATGYAFDEVLKGMREKRRRSQAFGSPENAGCEPGACERSRPDP